MGRDNLTEKQLIKETYAATLQPERCKTQNHQDNCAGF